MAFSPTFLSLTAILGILFVPSAIGNPAFVCRTEKHTIRIDEIAKATFRYRSWNLPKTPDQKPDVSLTSSDFGIEGTGPCTYKMYKFKTGQVQYSVNEGVGCTEEAPPAGAKGSLGVSVNGTERAFFYCTN